MITQYKVKTEEAIYVMLGIVLLLVIAIKAYHIPITHDELSTIDFSQKSIGDIISYADPIPNNHILNTLLLKCSIAIFGDRLFTDRLFNILSFVPFFIFTVRLSQLLFRDNWVRLTMVLMISLQLFLLDFYTITRGYGMSVAFEMISLYFFFKVLKENRQRDLVYAVLYGAIGVYANFTLLNYYIPLAFLLTLHAILTDGKTNKSQNYRSIGYIVGISLILGILSFLPVTKMMATKQFVYWGTSGFFNDTVKPLIIALRYGIEYFRWSNETIYACVLGFIMVGIIISILWYKKQDDKNSFKYALGLLLLVILYNNIQFYVASIPYLNARTALFFIPLVSICLVFGLNVILNAKKWVGLLLAICIMSLSIQHFIRGFNGISTFEWYYDANTYEVLQDLDEIIKNENLSTPVKLDCYWIFNPSMSYHIHHMYSDKLELLPYHKEIKLDSEAMFYYIQSDQQEQLSQKFEKIREYNWGSRVLMKLKK